MGLDHCSLEVVACTSTERDNRLTEMRTTTAQSNEQVILGEYIGSTGGDWIRLDRRTIQTAVLAKGANNVERGCVEATARRQHSERRQTTDGTTV